MRLFLSKLRLNWQQVVVTLVGLLLISAGIFAFHYDGVNDSGSATAAPTQFLMEVYSTIDKNFWKDLSEEQMTNLFTRGVSKLSDQDIEAKNKDQLESRLKNIIDSMDKNQRKRFPAELTDLVMKSLPPSGRSRLYTQKKEKKLAKRVQNADSDRSLYEILGFSEPEKEEVDKEDIEKAYEKKQQKLEKQQQSATTTEKKEKAKEKEEEVDYAKKVLTDEEDREDYDKNKSEPTVFTKRISTDVVHLGIHRYNKDTLNEFSQAVKGVDMNPKPSSLIIDLRSNLGGSIDILPYLLGPFIGPDRTAYKFFQQGDEEPHKTKTGWMKELVPYKKVVVLVNEKTQSTGELMAEVLKKYNVGTVVGTKTRGWGTVERIFDIDNQYRADRKYLLFLVHHLTLRADGQPIQDRGVIPEVKINQDDWQQQLRNYLPHKPLIEAVESVWNTPPPGTEV